MKKLLAVSILSLAVFGLETSRASAWLLDRCCGWRCCSKCTTTICCKQYNAFTPICFGSLCCTGGCCPVGLGYPLGNCCQPPCPPPCYPPCCDMSGCCPSSSCGAGACCDAGSCGGGDCGLGQLPPASAATGSLLPPGPLAPVIPGAPSFSPPMPTPLNGGAPMTSQVWPHNATMGRPAVQTVGYWPGYYGVQNPGYWQRPVAPMQMGYQPYYRPMPMNYPMYNYPTNNRPMSYPQGNYNQGMNSQAPSPGYMNAFSGD